LKRNINEVSQVFNTKFFYFQQFMFIERQ